MMGASCLAETKTAENGGPLCAIRAFISGNLLLTEGGGAQTWIQHEETPDYGSNNIPTHRRHR